MIGFLIPMTMKSLFIAPTAAAALLSVSCGVSADKRNPISSVPPAKTVTLAKGQTWGDGFWKKKITFPEGPYVARYEGKKGFFYECPDSLPVFDSGMRYGTQGGLYWAKGEAAPSKLYIDSPFGNGAILEPDEALQTRR